MGESGFGDRLIFTILLVLYAYFRSFLQHSHFQQNAYKDTI